MLYISWMVLNLVLSCLFIWLVYKAAIAVRNKFGWAAALLFVVGLMSFANAPSQKKENMVLLEVNPSSKNGTNQELHSAILEKFPLFTLHLDVVCDKVLDSRERKPVKAVAGQFGMVTGHQWQITTATVNYNTLDYNVYGTIHWKLLGIAVYAQSKAFRGSMAIE